MTVKAVNVWSAIWCQCQAEVLICVMVIVAVHQSSCEVNIECYFWYTANSGSICDCHIIHHNGISRIWLLKKNWFLVTRKSYLLYWMVTLPIANDRQPPNGCRQGHVAHFYLRDALLTQCMLWLSVCPSIISWCLSKWLKTSSCKQCCLVA